MKTVILRGGPFSGVIIEIEDDISGLFIESKYKPAVAAVLKKDKEMLVYSDTNQIAPLYESNSLIPKMDKLTGSAHVFEIDYQAMRENVQWEMVL